MEPLRTDVLIAGGGLVGASLGLALARAGIETLIVDSVSPDVAAGTGFDGRASAVASALCRMLTALDLWPDLEAQAEPIRDIVVSGGTLSGGASPLFLHFDHRETGAPLGHMIENRHLRLAQARAMATCAGVTVRAPDRVAALDIRPGHVRADLASGLQVRAALCVGAEGRNSGVRALAGLKTMGWSYPQAGIVTTVTHERPHEGVAQQLFLPAGPFAILPLKGNRSSLVWTERDDIAPEILARDAAGFAAELRRRFTDYLGEVAPVGPRWSYPLSLHLAREIVAPRVALVGDAAHVIHPLAGQGLNLGLKDVAALAETLVDARALGRDIGAPDVLEDYARWRRFDTVSLAAACDLLNGLFSNDNAAMRGLRELGLGLVDRIAPLRRAFMREAGGELGDLPRLLKGLPL